jgi:hypothetical protein
VYPGIVACDIAVVMTKTKCIDITVSEKQIAPSDVDEDVGTARTVRRARAALATGKEILLPKRVVDRLVSGANPVHILWKPARRGR